MTEETILDLEEKNEPARRPGLLKTLCILTWTGSAGLIANHIIHLVWFREMWMSSDAYLGSLIIGLGCDSLTILAAVMMWQLKRKGFWIYVIGELLPVVPAIMMIMESGADHRAIAGGIVVRIAFVAMYYRYYKIFR